MAATTMAVTSLVIAATSAVASGIQSYQQGKAQAAYQNAMAEQYRKSAEQQSIATAQEYANQSAAERVQQMQEKTKASMEIQEAQKEALQKAGTMMASTNAAGGTLNYLLNDYSRQEAKAKEDFRTQFDMATEASAFSMEAYKNKAQNRLDSRQSYTYIDASPDYAMIGLTTALNIGKGVTGAYGDYQGWVGMENKAKATGKVD
jgi:alanyl-tRNA synthetase